MKDYKMPEMEVILFVSKEEITDPATGGNDGSTGTTVNPFYLFDDEENQ